MHDNFVKEKWQPSFFGPAISCGLVAEFEDVCVAKIGRFKKESLAN
jgi:hypothetical protein